ncbi:B3GT4 galactosyltransferase, partial [Gymnorhina tibicen]|nr:B3GT4 galactosyltransferase [Gymnorhina tibicen]
GEGATLGESPEGAGGAPGLTGAAPRPPGPSPGCFGLLSGGSGDLDGGPHPLPTPTVLLSPAPCSPPAPFLLILVPSAPSHASRRLAVRDTWGSPPPGPPGTPGTRTVFVLGVPASAASQRELLGEWRRHGDILQGDFGDSYGNLTRKTLLLLRWARACCGGAAFLLKADDDVFVNAPAVATYLATWGGGGGGGSLPPSGLYLGRVHWGVAPNRDPRSRHHVPAGLYAARRFPPYCSGTAYVLSRQAAAAVLAAAPGVPRVGPEDVWVGLCARRAGLAA